MMKKYILPISALALMAFVGCDDTTSATVDDTPSSSAVRDSESSSSVSDDVADAKSSSSVKAETADKEGSASSKVATCEIKKKTATQLQMQIAVQDSVVINVDVQNKGSVISYGLVAELDESVSDEDVKAACETAGNGYLNDTDEELNTANVVCDGRKITVTDSIENEMGLMYSMMVPLIQEACDKIQETGELSDDLFGDEEEEWEPKAPEGCQEDVDMASDVWTVTTSTSKYVYTFDEKGMKVVGDANEDTGSPAMCQLSLSLAQGMIGDKGEFSCDGSVLKAKYDYYEEGATKDEHYDEVKNYCSSL